jgi:hypothetical protein
MVAISELNRLTFRPELTRPRGSFVALAGAQIDRTDHAAHRPDGSRRRPTPHGNHPGTTGTSSSLPSAGSGSLTLQYQSNDCSWACIWQGRVHGVLRRESLGGRRHTPSAADAASKFHTGSGGDIFGDFRPGLQPRRGTLLQRQTVDGVFCRSRDQANLSVQRVLSSSSGVAPVQVFRRRLISRSESESSFTYRATEASSFRLRRPATRQCCSTEISVRGTEPAPVRTLDRKDLRNLRPRPPVQKQTDRLSFNPGDRVDIQTGRSDLKQAVVDATTVSRA